MLVIGANILAWFMIGVGVLLITAETDMGLANDPWRLDDQVNNIFVSLTLMGVGAFFVVYL